MILDKLLPPIKKTTVTSNRWIDLIDSSKDMGWWEKYKLKKELKKSLSNYLPTISDLHEMASAIQILGMYYLYYNSDTKSDISSIKNKGTDIIRINMKDDFAVLLNIKNVNVSMSVYNPELVFEKRWTESNLESVAENKYEEILFDKVTKLLVKNFMNLIISYI